MKKALVLIMVLMVTFAISCSGEKETTKEKSDDDFIEVEESKKVNKISAIDPVNKEMVKPEDVVCSYVYKDTKYHFSSRENMEAFKKDPEKYLKD